MDHIAEELICCVCLDLFDSPVLLPCSHNLCRQCTRDLSNSNNSLRRSFDCPKCRYEVRFGPGEGLDSLPENKALRNIVSIIKKERSERLEDTTPTDIRLCTRHNIGKHHYCKTCRRTICETCLTETHSSFGHNVVAIDTVIEEQQEKADRAIDEIKSLKTLLEEQHQHILKNKDKISDYDLNVRRMVDSQFQNLLLNVNTIKLHLSTPPVEINEHRNSVIREERVCRQRLSEAEHLIKMYETSKRVSDPGRKIQKIENFLLGQTSFVAFKFTSDTFDVKDDQLPTAQLEGVGAVLAALMGVRWSVDAEKAIESKKTKKNSYVSQNRDVNILTNSGDEANGAMANPRQKRHSSEKGHQLAAPADEPCLSRTKDNNSNAEGSQKVAAHTDLNCNISEPDCIAGFKFAWKPSNCNSGKSHQGEAPAKTNSCIRHKEAAAIRRNHPQMAALSHATVTTAVLQGAPSVHSTGSSPLGAAPVGNIFSLCCRPKRANKLIGEGTSLPLGGSTSHSIDVSTCHSPGVSTSHPLRHPLAVKGGHPLSLITSRPRAVKTYIPLSVTSDHPLVFNAELVTSTSFQHARGVITDDPLGVSNGSAACNGTDHVEDSQPRANGNSRPLGVPAHTSESSQENNTVYKTIEHLDRILGSLAVSPASPSPTLSQKDIPMFSFHKSESDQTSPVTNGNDYHDNGATIGNHGDIASGDASDSTADDDNVVSGGNHDSLSFSLKPLNHAENSPFRVVEYFKSISDPGSASSNQTSQSEASSADEGPPTPCGSSSKISKRPNIHKSLSVETSHKPLFNIGKSPPTGKLRKNYNRKSGGHQVTHKTK